MTNIRNESEDFTIALLNIKRKIRKYCKQISANIFNNLDEMDN